MWPYVLSLMQRVMSYCESVVPNVCTWFGSDLAGSVCWISGRQTQWMKNQREPSAGKGAMRGHGETAQPCASAAWAVCRHSLDYCGICFILREVLKEDESGSLKATVEEILYQSKRKRCACLCLSVCLSIHPMMKMLVSSPAPHLMLSLLHRVIESHGQVRLGMVSCAEPCVSHMRNTFCGLLLKWSAVSALWNKA